MIISLLVIILHIILTVFGVKSNEDSTSVENNFKKFSTLKNATSKKFLMQRDLPSTLMHRQQFGYGNNPYSLYGLGGINTMPTGPVAENNVNFDFQCKCTARSNLVKNMQTPTDVNHAAQQQITQLQDQIRRLQEQIQRSSSGKSSFEQFAQMLSQADGLECNCSGASSALGSFPTNGNNLRTGNAINGMMPFPNPNTVGFRNSLGSNGVYNNLYNGLYGPQGLYNPTLAPINGQFYPTSFGIPNNHFYNRDGVVYKMT